ncbi:hypothetical protein [Leuconostoc citreum]|uniref:hypothetical protein n=1 Tax=Leuconostoc citreum TaxID=33964 RepID=UPI0032DE3E9E
MEKIKFGDWLEKFKDVDRPIGDLAKDMLKTDDVGKFNNFSNIADIPRKWQFRVYDVAVEAFEYYLVDSVDKYDIEYIRKIVANEKLIANMKIIGKEI